MNIHYMDNKVAVLVNIEGGSVFVKIKFMSPYFIDKISFCFNTMTNLQSDKGVSQLQCMVSMHTL